MTGDIFPLQALHRYFHSTLFFPYTNYFFSTAAATLSHLVVIFYYIHRL